MRSFAASTPLGLIPGGGTHFVHWKNNLNIKVSACLGLWKRPPLEHAGPGYVVLGFRCPGGYELGLGAGIEIDFGNHKWIKNCANVYVGP